MAKQKGSIKTGGRVKGILNKKALFLAVVLADNGISWEKEYTDAIKSRSQRDLDFWEKLLPYLVAKPSMTPFTPDQPSTPEQSLSNAKQAQELLKELEHDATGT